MRKAKIRRTPSAIASRFVPDLSGMVFGHLTVISRVRASNGKGYANVGQLGQKGRSSLWLCHCSCGAVAVKSRNYLRNCANPSCGHTERGRPIANLSGMVFGELTVIRLADFADDGAGIWLCQCSCGNQALVKSQNLRSGDTRSCGHLRRDNARRMSAETLREAARKGGDETDETTA